MSDRRTERDWLNVAESGPEGWPEFVRRMQQVAPPSPTALLFAREAFIAGTSRPPLRPPNPVDTGSQNPDDPPSSDRPAGLSEGDRAARRRLRAAGVCVAVIVLAQVWAVLVAAHVV